MHFIRGLRRFSQIFSVFYREHTFSCPGVIAVPAPVMRVYPPDREKTIQSIPGERASGSLCGGCRIGCRSGSSFFSKLFVDLCGWLRAPNQKTSEVSKTSEVFRPGKIPRLIPQNRLRAGQGYSKAFSGLRPGRDVWAARARGAPRSLSPRNEFRG
jgi:hypothetical protein